MKNIKLTFWILMILLTGVWLLVGSFPPETISFFSLRDGLVQYTGIMAIGAMSVAMILAARPRPVEAPLHGLDKMYRLHKWLGIGGLAFAIIHWFWAKGAKWMVGWGWLERPERHKQAAVDTLGAVEQFFRSQRALAESAGEWAFYAAILLIAIALISRIPYHRFVKPHKLLAAVYLVLVAHSVVLMKFDYWTQPVGIVMGLLMAGGTVGAVMSLFGLIGAGRKVKGRIEALTYYPELRVLETSIKLEDGWAGHEAGQFAFVTSDRREGAHPYTIASSWEGDGHITFITKALGDHTSRLYDRLKLGDAVKVEGPYGCFNFVDQNQRQIWIGAGIGITPFIARLKELAHIPGEKVIDLFHTTADYEEKAIRKLKADAEAANVTLHVLVDRKDGQLNTDRIKEAVPAWEGASIWFCGPAGFGQALRKGFLASGINPSDFHQELFHLR